MIRLLLAALLLAFGAGLFPDQANAQEFGTTYTVTTTESVAGLATIRTTQETVLENQISVFSVPGVAVAEPRCRRCPLRNAVKFVVKTPLKIIDRTTTAAADAIACGRQRRHQRKQARVWRQSPVPCGSVRSVTVVETFN